MSADVLKALAERVEGLSGADRSIDAEIEVAIGNWTEHHHEAWWRYEQCGEAVNPPLHQPCPPRRFTASLDAAMSLVPEGWRVDHLGERRIVGGWIATVGAKLDLDAGAFGSVGAATAAMAITSAALRALHHQTAEASRLGSAGGISPGVGPACPMKEDRS